MEIKPLQPVPTVTPVRKVKRDEPGEKHRNTDDAKPKKSQDGDADDGSKRVDTYA